MSSQNIYFKSFASDNINFHIQLQQRPFILRYSLFESDGCRIILFIFLGTQTIIFILRCLTAKVFIFFKNASPPPPNKLYVLYKKKRSSFNHSPIVPTAILITQPCSTGFGLVVDKISRFCLPFPANSFKYLLYLKTSFPRKCRLKCGGGGHQISYVPATR